MNENIMFLRKKERSLLDVKNIVMLGQHTTVEKTFTVLSDISNFILQDI